MMRTVEYTIRKRCVDMYASLTVSRHYDEPGTQFFAWGNRFAAKWVVLLLVLGPVLLSAQKLRIASSHISRELSFDGKVWRTTAFASVKGAGNRLAVHSEEFDILPMDSAEGYDIGDFIAVGTPAVMHQADSVWLDIIYEPISKLKGHPGVPDKLTIHYYAAARDNFIRKSIRLDFERPETVDRLEVERLELQVPAKGGGRGQPVFAADKWFFGLEYPAGYSRHSDGNTPVSYGRYFEKVGNYSYIDLEGRDIEPQASGGMLRLMHFPGYAKKSEHGHYIIQSKTAVTGTSEGKESARAAFIAYLSTVWKAPRSFLHYNNWFDRKAKDLSGNALVDVYKSYEKAIRPYGVHLDAVVPDNGWQDTKSIWAPNPRYFPKGDSDLAGLSRRLKQAGVGFGLWLSLNGYVNDIQWGVLHGYHQAKPNAYFSQFSPYYSLSATKYQQKMLQRLPELAKLADVKYFKHDFNNLSDIAAGNGHPPDDRHGHEANVDAAIALLTATTAARPGILQNMTNWVWFSPWWLQYADYLWMLAGDDGMNGNQPELSATAERTTDRDTYIWRMWGNPDDRPLVPVSRLMTHGIIRSQVPAATERLQDWLEYVLMYYGRGTLLKEWYISPETMNADAWKGLCLTDNWAARHRSQLNRTVFVGGRPDEGHTYGYIGWNAKGDSAVLVARNPGPAEQTLHIPVNEVYGYSGLDNIPFKTKVVFPYQDTYAGDFRAGKDLTINLPGYATMAFEITKGSSKRKPATLSQIHFQTKTGTAPHTLLTVPADAAGLCALQVIGYLGLPEVFINGKVAKAVRTNVSHLNNFADYAKSGMYSTKARKWTMAAFDLSAYRGQKIDITYQGAREFESYLQVERIVANSKTAATKDYFHLWPITQNTRRQSVRLH